MRNKEWTYTHDITKYKSYKTWVKKKKKWVYNEIQRVITLKTNADDF